MALLVLVGWLIVRYTGFMELRFLVVMAAVCLGLALVTALLPERVDATLELRPQRTSVGLESRAILRATNTGRLPMWQPSVDLPTPGRSTTIRLPVLRPRLLHVEEVTLPAEHRGVHRVGPVTARHLDPLNLIQRDVVWTQAEDWFVWPRVVAVESFGMGAIADLEGMPSDTISMSDLSFHALREYHRGDDLRHVHWRSSAKADTLLVRQYHDTKRSHATVIVDASPEVYPDAEDFELALSTAASVILRAAAEDFDVTFLCGAQEVDRETAEQVLDACCRAELETNDLAEVSERALRLAPETSLLLLCTGSRRDGGTWRSALSMFSNDVRRVVIEMDGSAPTSLRTIASLQHATLGDLRDLPMVIAGLAARKS